MAQGAAKPLVAGSSPAAACFYIRDPEPKGWHLGQKQVPLLHPHCSPSHCLR